MLPNNSSCAGEREPGEQCKLTTGVLKSNIALNIRRNAYLHLKIPPSIIKLVAELNGTRQSDVCSPSGLGSRLKDLLESSVTQKPRLRLEPVEIQRHAV